LRILLYNIALAAVVLVIGRVEAIVVLFIYQAPFELSLTFEWLWLSSIGELRLTLPNMTWEPLPMFR
jgi:hypothetical protein